MIIRRIQIFSEPAAFFFFSFILFLSLLAVLFSASPLCAETYYVKPSSEVVVRRGQGNEYKIIAMVKDGTSVELLEDGETYARVALADGKEGWMLKRFLSNELPLNEVVTTLRAEKEELGQREVETREKLEEVSSTLSRAEMERDSTLAERDRIWTDYQALQEDTADVVKIQKDLVKTAQENELLIQTLTSLKEERDGLKQDYAIKWFLVGGGVLLTGILMGMILGRSRKKKSTFL